MAVFAIEHGQRSDIFEAISETPDRPKRPDTGQSDLALTPHSPRLGCFWRMVLPAPGRAGPRDLCSVRHLGISSNHRSCNQRVDFLSAQLNESDGTLQCCGSTQHCWVESQVESIYGLWFGTRSRGQAQEWRSRTDLPRNGITSLLPSVRFLFEFGLLF
jgi:hypothetical protein